MVVTLKTVPQLFISPQSFTFPCGFSSSFKMAGRSKYQTMVGTLEKTCLSCVQTSRGQGGQNGLTKSLGTGPGGTKVYTQLCSPRFQASVEIQPNRKQTRFWSCFSHSLAVWQVLSLGLSFHICKERALNNQLTALVAFIILDSI